MTLVSYTHDFIYLRTRKTASSSISMYLQPFCAPPGTAPIELNPFPLITDYGIVSRSWGKNPVPPEVAAGHPGASLAGPDRQWVAHMEASRVRDRLAPGFWKRAIKLTSVRNPFARIVSSFYWQGAFAGKPKEELAPEVQVARFRRMVLNGKFQDDREIVFLEGRFVPELLIRQEHLVEDLAGVASRLGLDTTHSHLPVTKKTASSNETARPSLADLYDDETADIVRDRFDWVFVYAGYSREIADVASTRATERTASQVSRAA